MNAKTAKTDMLAHFQPLSIQQGTARFCDLVADLVSETSLAFRTPGEFDPKTPANKKLRESIAARRGLYNPLLVRQMPDGTLKVVAGHRRYEMFKTLIDEGAEGFTVETEIPVALVAGEISEAALAALSVSTNVEGKVPGGPGRMAGARYMEKAGLSDKTIASIYQVCLTQIQRDLAMAKDPVMLAHYQVNNIGFTDDGKLCKCAQDKNREEDMHAAFEAWVAETRAKNKADEQAREERGDKNPKRKRQLKNQLKPEQVTAWLEAMKNDEPLGKFKPRLRVAVLRDDKGDRIEVDRFRLFVRESIRADWERIKDRLLAAANDVDEILNEKFGGQTQEVEVENDIDDEPADDELADDEPVDDEPVDDEPVDDEPVDDEPVDDEPVDDEPVDDEPVDDEPVDDELADDEPAVVAPAAAKKVAATPKVSTTGSDQAATKPAAAKPAAAKPAAAKASASSSPSKTTGAAKVTPKFQPSGGLKLVAPPEAKASKPTATKATATKTTKK